MDEIVDRLVARYQTDDSRPEVKKLSEFKSRDALVLDLRRELDDILKDRNEPFDMKHYMMVILKAVQILQGKG